MANFEGGYLKVPSDLDSDPHSSIGRRLKAGATLLGGSCLVVFLIVATYSTLSLPALHSTNAAESTNLFSMMRAPAPVVPARGAPSFGQLPGNVNSMNNLGKFLSQGFRPLYQNSPYHSRFGNLAPKGFFDDLFKNVRNDKLYEKTEWQAGDKCDYFSSSARTWLNAKITEVDANGRVQVDVKPGAWISENAQKTQLRKKFGVKGYATNKGKYLDLPERSTDAQKKLIEKQKDIENKYFR